MLCLSGFELYSRWVPLFTWHVISISAENKPSKYKGAGTRKDKQKHCKSALSVVLEEFHHKVVV